MFKKIAIALLFLGIVFPVKADEQPLDLESFGLIPSERKKDMPKGKNPFELIPIEQNSDSKLTQQENYEDIYIDKAKNYIDKKEYKKAIESLDKAISLNPKDSDSYYWRGYAYSGIKQYQKAIADYSKSINLNPQDAPVYSARGNAYDELKQYGKAVDDYSKAISLNPQDASFYYARGVSYNGFGEYQKAKLDLIKASKLYKETGDIASYNDVQESLKIIEENIANSQPTNQENDEAYYLKIVNSYMQKKEYETAIEILNKAIILYPENSDFYVFRGYAYSEIKQYQKAILDQTKSISLDPQNSNNYHGLGLSYSAIGQYQKAIENYTKAINLNPQYAPIYYARGLSYNNLGEYQKAKLDLIKASELYKETGNITFYNNVQKSLKKTEENGKLNTADNLLRENKNEDAIVFLDEAIALNPQNALSYYMRGMAYLALNQYPKALLDYTKSISLDPQNAKYYSMRGLYYNNRGEYQKAKSDFIQAGKLFKNKGDIENYNIANKNLKITEQNIAFKATQEASKKRTRELLVKRACLMGKQGYTDGEIGNEIYRLVRINTPAPRRTASSISPYSNSIGRQFAEIFDNLFENLNNVDMQDKTSDIMQVAKKRCKF